MASPWARAWATTSGRRQLILVQRSSELVVMATTEWRGMDGDVEGSATINVELELMVGHILGAVR